MHWECVRLGRADGRLGGDSPFCPPGGDTVGGKRWHLGLEFRKWGSGSWDQARACREHGKSPVSLTCPLGPLATWQQQSAARLPVGVLHTGPFGVIHGLVILPRELVPLLLGKTQHFYSTIIFSFHLS